MDLISIGIVTDEGRNIYDDNRDMNPRAIVGTFAAESIAQAASFAAEGARIVCHTQINQVSTVYAVVAEFYTAAFAMQTAAQNMIGDLSRMAAKGDLYDAHPGGDPGALVDLAKVHLEQAAAHAEQLGRALQAVQNDVAGVGHKG